MIVVLSYSNYEQGTEYVIDWLVYLKANFVKITMEDMYSPNSDFRLDVSNRKLYLKEHDLSESLNVFFYRRLFMPFKLNSDNNEIFRPQIENEVTDEHFSFVQYLFFLFQDKKWLPSPGSVNVNKLVMLNMAQMAGLQIPKSIVTNNKKDLLSFYKKCDGQVITKPICKSSYYIVGKYTYFANVNSIEQSTIEDLPLSFSTSLFQEKVDRDFEIRVFYLDGIFFALAMLVEGGYGHVDIKLNNESSEAHWVNYNLPLILKNKISRFMASINLNTGSLDIVKLQNGDYCFLEVNPVGQYGHPSHFGNFELERLIAEWLVKNDNHE